MSIHFCKFVTVCIGFAAALVAVGCEQPMADSTPGGAAIRRGQVPPGPPWSRGHDPGVRGDGREAIPGPGLDPLREILDREMGARPAESPTAGRVIRPYPIDGNFVPSGWMGDAEVPDGPLSYHISRENPASGPTCEEWTYDPSKGALQGWVAVAYQYPDKNWGTRRGKDLSGRGFTRIRFRARAQAGSPILIVRAGSHTSPDAAYPASFETEAIVIPLGPGWSTHEISLEGMDLSNVPTAFAFTLRRADCDGPVAFCLDDIEFRGPED